MKTRFAIVRSDKPAIAAYLPSNYRVTRVEDGVTHIEGEDRLGWTLDGYVIPRLGSGMFGCSEVTP